MTSTSFDAIVIGGGIAGAGTAHALAARGQSVLVCESQPHLAAKASGNARGLLMPYVATQSSPPGRLYSRGFRYSQELLHSLGPRCPFYHQSGAIQLPSNKRLVRILHESAPFCDGIVTQRISAEGASERSGIPISTPCFYLPEAGYCDPRELTANLIGSAQLPVTVRCSVEVTALTATENSWRVSLGTGEDLTSSTVILCGAYEVTRLSQTSWIPLEAIRGQTAQSFATPLSEKLKTLISFGGYITPADDGSHFIGAHYRHNDMNETPTEGDTAEVISRLYAALPSISGLTPNSSRVCFRASTHDRLPYIGELPSHDKPPLFINAGHGSRGLITAPMGGEIIARMIHKEKLEDLAESASIASAERIEKRRPRVHL